MVEKGEYGCRFYRNPRMEGCGGLCMRMSSKVCTAIGKLRGSY
jgi:hypothetical protein